VLRTLKHRLEGPLAAQFQPYHSIYYEKSE